MSGSLHGRVALVTGGSGGIGRALVRRLAADGADVAVGYSAHADSAHQATEEARASGVRAVSLAADLTSPGAALDLVDRAEAELGPVDVLAANAGLGTRAELADIDAELWRRTLAVNLEAPFRLAQRLVPAMAERGWGRVLVTSSLAAFTGGIVGPHYAASKAGLHGMVAWFAGRFADRGVTVNALAPALVEGTAMLPVTPGAPPPTAVGRYGTPEEVADLALAMLTNGYLTGKVYLLDGGMHPR